MSSTSSPSTHRHSARCGALLGAGGRTVGGIRIRLLRLGTSDQLSVCGCSNIFDEAWRPAVGQAEAVLLSGPWECMAPLLRFDSYTMNIVIIRNTPYISPGKIHLIRSLPAGPDAGIQTMDFFAISEKPVRITACFGHRVFFLHSPVWSMAMMDASRIQHHTTIPSSSFTRSTLIHAADPEPAPRVDVLSPAASSRSVAAPSVSYHLPNQTTNAPHQKIYLCTASLDHTSPSAGGETPDRPRRTSTARSPPGFTKLPITAEPLNPFGFKGQTTICIVTTCPDGRPIVLMPSPTPESDDGLRMDGALADQPHHCHCQYPRPPLGLLQHLTPDLQ